MKVEKYIFKDGRVGTKTYSDRIYKTIKVPMLNDKREPILDDNGNIVHENKNIMYLIRKKNSEDKGIYDIAIDILPYEYEEISDEEMAKLIKEI